FDPVELPNAHCAAPGSTATPVPGTAPAVPGRGRSGASPSTTPICLRRAGRTRRPPPACCGCRRRGLPGRPARTRSRTRHHLTRRRATAPGSGCLPAGGTPSRAAPPFGRLPTAPYPSPAGTAAGPGTGSPSVAGERRLDRRGRDVEAAVGVEVRGCVDWAEHPVLRRPLPDQVRDRPVVRDALELEGFRDVGGTVG